MHKSKAISGIKTVIIIALGCRLLLFTGMLIRNPNGFFQNDSYGYWQIAENILNHGCFSMSESLPLEPDHTRTPLYPLFIGALRGVGFGSATIVFVQVLLSSATCILVISLTHKLVGSWKPAILAGAILAVDIPSIVLSNCLLTETLFTFVLTLSILELIIYFKQGERMFQLFSSGVLMGLSVLCRPIAFLLPFFIIILFFLFSKETKINIIGKTTVYLVFCFLVVSPWLIRNQLVFGSPFLSTIGYQNLLYYRAAGAYAVEQGIPLSRAQELLHEKARSAFRGSKEEEPVEYKKVEARIATSIILKHLSSYIRNHVLSTFDMLFRPIRSTIDLQLGFSQTKTTLTTWDGGDGSSLLSRLLQKTSTFTIILVAVQFAMLLVLWVSFIYCIIPLFVKREHLIICIVALIVGYFCIMSGGPEAYARFRVPIVPFLAIGGGIGIAEAYERFMMRTKDGF